MSLVRLVARPMLASVFVVQGAKNLRDPEPAIPSATTFVERYGPLLEKRVPALPTDPKTLVRLGAATQLGAGLALATGRLPRLAAAVLVASLVPTTVAGHPYWQADDPAQRDSQRVQVLKNTGLAGGLLLATVDTEGKPGLSYRARCAARGARRTAQKAKRKGRKATRGASSRAHAILPT